jgi:hypothetical protein
LGVNCLVANTASEAWKFKHLKRKTDRDDALRVAEVYLLGKFISVAIPDKEILDKRALIEHRQKLEGRRVRLAEPHPRHRYARLSNTSGKLPGVILCRPPGQ